MSQAQALQEHLLEAGHSVEAVFLGGRPGAMVPGYFMKDFEGRIQGFRSPWFLRTPNKKGIYVARTMLLHLLLSFHYLAEIRRIRKAISQIRPDVVFNFYDLVGALALRKVAPEVQRIGIGHHFFLHLDGYRCNRGSATHRWLLKWHTQLNMASCDRVLALSYTEQTGNELIQVVPPLVRRSFREMVHRPGERYLAYFLHEGFFYDLLELVRSKPDFRVDLFSTLKPGKELPDGLILHDFDAEKFSNFMGSCRGIITSAGFDTAAEAAWGGIPLAVVPSRQHFEQRCNAADIERSRIGVAVDQIGPDLPDRIRSFDAGEYRAWADRAGEMIIACIR